jgi:hypothetical protein
MPGLLFFAEARATARAVSPAPASLPNIGLAHRFASFTDAVF